MRQRKQVMEDRSDAFLALPGGIGTLEELFETWTAGYLGMHEKPVVLLDPVGHYDGLRTWLDGLVDTGYVARPRWTGWWWSTTSTLRSRSARRACDAVPGGYADGGTSGWGSPMTDRRVGRPDSGRAARPCDRGSRPC